MKTRAVPDGYTLFIAATASHSISNVITELTALMQSEIAKWAKVINSISNSIEH